MKKKIDCSKLPCPQPLVLTKKAVESSDADILEVMVDNKAAKENIIKYAKFAKIPITGIKENGDNIILTLDTGSGKTVKNKSNENVSNSEKNSHTAKNKNTEKHSSETNRAVFIRSDAIGTENRELGLLLMRGFIYTMTEMNEKTASVILMNNGVRLAVKGSDSVGNLLKLEKQGIDIIVCGTCLDYLGLTTELKVGKISNMYDITEILINTTSVVTV